MLKFKNDAEIAKLVESVEIGDPAKNDEGNFSKLLREMVEEVLDEAPAVNCAKQPPRAESMRFELVVIERARAHGGSGVENECAAGAWYQNPKTGEVTKIGKQADDAIAEAIKFGFETDDFKGATMGGVGKSAPQWELDKADKASAAGEKPYKPKKIEPKTDVMFGNKKISLKMKGAVQAASSEGKGTAEVLNFVIDEWVKENAENQINKAGKQAAVEEINELFAEVKDMMLEHGKTAFLANKRAKQITSFIDNYSEELEQYNVALEKQASGEGLTAKEKKQLKTYKPEEMKNKLKKYEKYKNAFIANEFIDESGNILKKEFDFDNWQEHTGTKIQEKLENVFNKFSAVDAAGNNTLSLKSALADELMSGRRAFAGSPGAIADYVLSPEHCFSLVPGDKKYEEAIKVFSEAIKLGVRSKGDRKLGSAEKGLNIGVGCKVSYRYDIKPQDIEEAMEKLAAEVTQAAATNERGDIIAEDSTTSDAEAKIEPIIEKSLAAIKNEMVNMVARALDVEETAASMLENTK